MEADVGKRPLHLEALLLTKRPPRPGCPLFLIQRVIPPAVLTRPWQPAFGRGPQ